MWNFVENRTNRRFSNAGRLSCPVRAVDVEVDACLTCSWLTDVRRDGENFIVRCRPAGIHEYK